MQLPIKVTLLIIAGCFIQSHATTSIPWNLRTTAQAPYFHHCLKHFYLCLQRHFTEREAFLIVSLLPERLAGRKNPYGFSSSCSRYALEFTKYNFPNVRYYSLSDDPKWLHLIIIYGSTTICDFCDVQKGSMYSVSEHDKNF